MADVTTNDAAQSDVDVVINEPRLTGEWPSVTIELGVGPMGMRGEKGDRGEQGDRGYTGETGNGIASAVLNADYTLTLTYTDGTTWTSGSIRGERGEKGETGADGYTPVKGVDYFDGEKGDTGADGYSPAASVTQTETGATISITDAEGTTTANIRNGQDGAPGAPGSPGNDGVSPTISVTDITDGHRVTITDATGAHSFDVMDGESGQGAVQDVQVAGVSVLNDGVANVPYAGSNIAGVVVIAPSSTGGLNINRNNGRISTFAAVLSELKAGADFYKPVVPSHQHESTFYGLAKAAGSDEKDSTLPVGQYTESAKSAIQTMLGISNIIGTVEGATASTAYSVGGVFLHGGALYKATTAIASGDAIVPGTNCEQTTIIDILKGA